jgi:hypothetical protein
MSSQELKARNGLSNVRSRNIPPDFGAGELTRVDGRRASVAPILPVKNPSFPSSTSVNLFGGCSAITVPAPHFVAVARGKEKK